MGMTGRAAAPSGNGAEQGTGRGVASGERRPILRFSLGSLEPAPPHVLGTE